MATPEPDISKGQNPEQSLQRSLVIEIRSILSDVNADFLLLEGFGLDIAVFILFEDRNYARFLEVKVFVGSRPGGVGIGNGRGEGSQIDLLLHGSSHLQRVDPSIRWVLGKGLLPSNSPRYALFSSNRAQSAAMNGIARGKQNNLRVGDFQDELVTWSRLSELLRQFLLE